MATSNVNIRVRITGEKLEEAARRLPSALDRRMLQAADRSARMVEVNAKGTALFRDRSTHLRRSIQRKPPSGRFSSGTLEVDIIAGGNRAPYGRFVHDGTRGPYLITPKRPGGILAWPTSGGGVAFAKSVMHPGLRPRPFMVEGARKSLPNIRSTFRNAVHAAFIDAGFEG